MSTTEGRKFLVTYEAEDGPKSAVARDVALGGLFIETKEPLAVGALLSVELSSPKQTATLEARVFDVRPKREGAEKPAGMAVRFIDLPDAMLVKLQEVLEHHRPPARTRLGVGDDTEALWASAGGRDEAPPGDEEDEALLLAASIQVEGRPTPDEPILAPKHPTPKMVAIAPPTSVANPPSLGSVPPAPAASVAPPSSLAGWASGSVTPSQRPGPPYVPPSVSVRPPAEIKTAPAKSMSSGVFIVVAIVVTLAGLAFVLHHLQVL